MMKSVSITNNGNVLRGTAHLSDKKNPIPVVICHGYFSANRIGPQRLFVEMGEELSKRGFDTYRFDLSGMGESDGTIDGVVFSQHVDDLKAIIGYVKSLYTGQKICLVAHCLGCNYALVNVLNKDDIYREIIFLAPFYSNDEILGRFFSESSLHELKELSFTHRKGLYAHESFFSSNPQSEMIDRINAVKVMINIIIPENDQLIPLEENEKTVKDAKFANMIYMAGADHNFLEHKKEVISLVGDLLTDEKYTI